MLFIAARVQDNASCHIVCPTGDATLDIARPLPLDGGGATVATAGDGATSATQPAQGPGPQTFFNLTAGDNPWTLIDASQSRACTWIGAPRVRPWWEEDTPQPVPEPSTIALTLIGLVGLGYARRRQTSRDAT
jgi:hypothetical protein